MTNLTVNKETGNALRHLPGEGKMAEGWIKNGVLEKSSETRVLWTGLNLTLFSKLVLECQ